MHTKTLMDLEEIHLDMSASIGMIDVIADGLSCYTYANALSGEHAQKYVDALNLVYESLTAMNEKLWGELTSAMPGKPRGAGDVA